MSTENILKKFEEYCEYETNQYKRIVNSTVFFTKEEIITAHNYTLQRMLGSALFCQDLGCEFEDVDHIYETYKNNINNN